MWEKEKMLVTSIFSFSQNDFMVDCVVFFSYITVASAPMFSWSSFSQSSTQYSVETLDSDTIFSKDSFSGSLKVGIVW